MEDLNAGLSKLQLLVQALLKKYTSLKKENENLKSLNNDMQKLLAEKQKLIDASTERLVTNNLTTLYTNDEKLLLQSKIESYIKDIEKCLSMLNA